MADSFSISSINVASLARISPLALPLSATGTVTSNSGSLESPSSIVALSSNGQLLSVLSSGQSQLSNSLQASVATPSPENTSALAQSLFATFNSLQGSTNALQGVLGNEATNPLFFSALANNGAQLASLSRVGIDFQAASGTLSFNPDIFNAALASDPDATTGLLNNAAQALLDVSSGIELQLAGASLVQTNPALLASVVDTTPPSTGSGSSIPIELLQNLSADSTLNNIQLSDLDLAAAGQEIDAILTDARALPGALSTDLPISGNTILLATSDLADRARSSAANESIGQATGSVQLLTTTSVNNGLDNALPLTTALPTSTVTSNTTEAAAANAAAPIIGDAEAADLRAATTQMALQTMLSDPRLQVLRNILDPYYPALAAATRISEMSPFMPIVDPQAFADDFPAQVLAAQGSRPISNYKEAPVGA